MVPCASGEGEFLVSIEGRDSDATAVREALNVVPCNYQWKQAAMRGKWMATELPFAQQPQCVPPDLRRASSADVVIRYALKVEKQAAAVIVLAPHERDSVARSSLQLFRVAEKAQLRDEKVRLVATQVPSLRFHVDLLLGDRSCYCSLFDPSPGSRAT